MSLTLSKMIPLGSIAPDFILLDTRSGEFKTLAQLKGKKATVAMFICNHCPFVQHINPGLVKLGKDYKNSDVSIIAISANDVVTHPQDSPAEMAKIAFRLGYEFPYLYDENQNVARAYGAACTPDIFLFDENLALIYRGQFDDSRPDNGIKVSGKDLREAIENYRKGIALNIEQKPSIGCNIKWKQ